MKVHSFDSSEDSGTLTITILDAGLAAEGQAADEYAGASGRLVASFTSDDVTDRVGEFSASIDWGDGVETGEIVADATVPGRFDVYSSRVFAVDGVYGGAVTITKSGSNASATASSTVTVTTIPVSPILTVTGFQAAQGVAVQNATVGHLAGYDPGSSGPFPDAVIDWGDGTTTAGTVVADADGYAIVGDHTYADPGTFYLTVTVSAGEYTPVGHDAVTVLDKPVSTGGTTFTATAGVAFSDQFLVSMGGTNTNHDPDDYEVTILWGDGTTSDGRVADAGSLSIVGSHTYEFPGVYSAVVLLTSPDGMLSIGAATAVVGDSVLSAAAAGPVSGGATVLDTVLATITSGNSGTSAAGLSVTIDWGDGSGLDAGDIVGSGGNFAVLGSHIYTLSGTYPVGVTVRDRMGRTVSTATWITVDTVLSDPAVQLQARPAYTTEGKADARTVAVFVDRTPGRSASDYTATVDPGDGTGPHAATVEGADGIFRVRDSHGYAVAGAYTFGVTIQGPDGPLTDQAAAQIAAAPFSLAAADWQGEVDVEASGVLLGILTSTNTLATTSAFTVSVDWGDGTQGSANLVALGGGVFEVRGSHTYASAAAYTFAISVDHQAGGGSASATGRADIVVVPDDVPDDPVVPTLEASGQSLSADEGDGVRATVATFETDPSFAASDFTATIDWGDNQSGAGEIVDEGDGYFSVVGTHVYARGDSYDITVAIQGPNGLTATVTSSAAVAGVDWTFEGTEAWTVAGVPLQNAWLGFVTDPNPSRRHLRLQRHCYLG